MGTLLLTDYITDAELIQITGGMRTFIRLTGMIHDEFQHRWFADEADAKSSILAIARTFKASERMLGKQKYQGQPFDAARQVREDMAASMLGGADESIMVANRKRYSPLYYLIVEPIINALSKYDHKTILEIVEDICHGFVAVMENTTCYGNYDDALIAQAQVRRVIADREEAIKVLKASRKRKKRKVETNFFEDDAEVVVDEAAEESEDDEVEELQ